MLISYKWLQHYFPKPLPKPEELARLFTFHAFEVEGMEKKGEDTIFDVKILPDRAHYCLSHRGVAGEVAAITGMPITEMLKETDFPKIGKVRDLKIEIKEKKLCRRYIGRVVENVKIEKSSGWLKEFLEAINQRSINTVVDSANFVMFDLGQPLHAFDSDKVKGGIVIRLAKAGEKIITLDNRDVTLDEKTLVIADDEGPLAIAGVKGGKRAEVTEATKNLILESANFEPANIRKTSVRLGIKTDASKRYENEITPVLCEKAMDEFSVFIKTMCKGAIFGEKVDKYPAPVKPRVISFDPKSASKILGVEIPEEKIIEILRRLEIGVERKSGAFSLTIPDVRLDLEIPEDIVEEIGRLYGYENLKPVPLPETTKKPAINKNFYYQNKIREILTNLGYSEVYTYALQNSGEVELENPIASDKAFLRKDLSALQKSLEMNQINAPLLGVTDIRVFEIGKVFGKDGEHIALGIGFLPAQKKKAAEISKAEFDMIADEFKKAFGSAPAAHTISTNVMEAPLDEFISQLPEPISYDISYDKQNLVYKKPSPYPFIVRDIAIFVSPEIKSEEVEKIICDNAGNLVVKGPTLFDEFQKADKKSLAFRVVFQSPDRTLTDEEVNKMMEKVYSALKSKNWEIR